MGGSGVISPAGLLLAYNWLIDRPPHPHLPVFPNAGQAAGAVRCSARPSPHHRHHPGVRPARPQALQSPPPHTHTLAVDTIPRVRPTPSPQTPKPTPSPHLGHHPRVFCNQRGRLLHGIGVAPHGRLANFWRQHRLHASGWLGGWEAVSEQARAQQRRGRKLDDVAGRRSAWQARACLSSRAAGLVDLAEGLQTAPSS